MNFESIFAMPTEFTSEFTNYYFNFIKTLKKAIHSMCTILKDFAKPELEGVDENEGNS